MPQQVVMGAQLACSFGTTPSALTVLPINRVRCGNQFAANIWGAKLLLDKAIPMALKTAKPGTREFRLAIKQALETMGEVVVPQGVLRYSATDHFGYDERARFVLTAQGGVWRAVK